MINDTQTNGTPAMALVIGAIGFGRYEGEGVDTQFATAERIKPLLAALRRHRHVRLDTARMYGQGSPEEILGEAD